eukprot:TRINITY_DN4406_c1_g2_i2.p1 TRINITY_DN4406_c1_g2~~TRINITY_DN4406_c1_g2_i2.p1  ORF type:complete len:802 (+),score=276.07 TRINITY_DN4406_c1_g2_i2:57-2462(+)
MESRLNNSINISKSEEEISLFVSEEIPLKYQPSWFTQFFALSKKKLLYIKRDKAILLTCLLIPTIMILTLVLLTSMLQTTSVGTSNSFDNLPHTFNLSIVSPSNKSEPIISNLDYSNTICGLNEFDNLSHFNSYYYNDDSYTAGGYDFHFASDYQTIARLGIIYNSTISHALPTFLVEITSAIYRTLAGKSNISIKESQYDIQNADYDVSSIEFLFYGPLLIEYAFVFLSPTFAVKIIEEKEKKLKIFLLTNSMRRSAYWFANCLADYFCYLIPTTICIICMYAIQLGAFVNNTFLAIFLLFFLYGFTAIGFGYLLSFLFQKEESASKWLFMVTSLLAIIPYIVIQLAFSGETDEWPNYLCSIFPPYVIARVISLLAIYDQYNMPLDVNDLFNPEYKIIYYYLILILEAVFCFSVTIWLDFGIQRFGNCCTRNYKSTELNVVNQIPVQLDQDVEEEFRQAHNVFLQLKQYSKIVEQYPVLINDISKQFPNNDKSKPPKLAVQRFSLCIKNGECFGLLGPNGAGKTTTISILTGLEKADSGDAFISAYSITKNFEDVYSIIGICPQQNILWDKLTGREHLELFAKIRGIASDAIDIIVERSLNNFGLKDHADKQTVNYSGGMKRKLCVSIAFLGDPKVVFLDEPSTGMDPLTRRKLWELIKSKKKNCVVILTTHSMEEADALCERIGIMTCGRLRCIGSSQHLKSKYGNGYQLSLKINLIQLEDAHDYVMGLFPRAELKHEMAATRIYEIPQNKIPLAQVFANLQTNAESKGIIDYAFSQPTLEQVFLRFAAEQVDSVENNH